MKKVLYGLKKVSTTWYSKIYSYMIMSGFCRRNIEPTLYRKINEHGQILVVFLYVDDMIFIGDFELDEFKVALRKNLR